MGFVWSGGEHGVGVCDINRHIDINMNIDINIIINMGIEDYTGYYLLFNTYSLLAIPFWVFPVGNSVSGIPYKGFYCFRHANSPCIQYVQVDRSHPAHDRGALHLVPCVEQVGVKNTFRIGNRQ